MSYAVKSSFLLSFLESVPEAVAKLKAPIQHNNRRFEDVIQSGEEATVLVLVTVAKKASPALSVDQSTPRDIRGLTFHKSNSYRRLSRGLPLTYVSEQQSLSYQRYRRYSEILRVQ